MDRPSLLDPFWTRRRTLAAVLTVTLVGLLARLVVLDNRVAHWDEARVAWWILDYRRSGSFQFQAIMHGPFIEIVTAHVFDALGTTDVSMRLPVAVIGGLFPLSALLLRRRLGDAATVVLAGFFAANPLLLYYSRFMRNDVLVAAFAFVAFGCLVRLVDTRHPVYLYGAGATIALAMTTKGNALLYLVAWAGALVLLADHRLLRSTDPQGTLVGWYRSVVRRAWQRSALIWTPHVLGTGILAALILLYFYAPRAPPGGGVGIWNAVADPSMAPDLLHETYVGSWEEFRRVWGRQENAYLEYLGDLLNRLLHGSVVIGVLGLAGLVVDRYRDGGPADLVVFAGYWGIASAVGYPIATDIKAPWTSIHVLVPLAIPAAVAVVVLGNWTADAIREADRIGAGAGVLVLLLLAGGVVVPAAHASFVAPTGQHHEIAQYAQPSNDLRPLVDRTEAIIPNNAGPDVLFYGDHFVSGQETAERTPACLEWFDALPLPWYTERSNGDVACAQDVDELEEQLEADPPVVVTRRNEASDVASLVDDRYERTTVEYRLWGVETAFFVDETAVPER